MNMARLETFFQGQKLRSPVDMDIWDIKKNTYLHGYKWVMHNGKKTIISGL